MKYGYIKSNTRIGVKGLNSFIELDDAEDKTIEIMKIKVTVSPSEIRSKTFHFNLSDMGMSVEDWSKLSDREKELAITAELDGMAEQPYWTLDGYIVE